MRWDSGTSRVETRKRETSVDSDAIGCPAFNFQFRHDKYQFGASAKSVKFHFQPRLGSLLPKTEAQPGFNLDN